MSAQPQPLPVYTATCRVCQKLVGKFNSLDIPIIGQPNKRTKELLTHLGMHVAKEHPDQWAAGLALISDFQAWLVLSQFVTEEPSIGQRFETIRAGLQALTRKFTLSDQQIQDSVVALDAQNQLTAENVITMMKGLRDVLTEQGQYAPKLEPQNKLVV